MIFALIVFFLTYALLLILPNHRAQVALGSALIFLISNILSPREALAAIDFNVILMLGGTMGIVALFIESRMPSLLAELLLSRVPDVKWAIISLALLAGIISAFVDNVATVLMVVPVALTIAKKLNISPIPSVIAISISSNLQGAATLVGDATAILLGSHAKMTFFDFFLFQGKPGMFWVVQGSAISFTLVCLLIFRKYSQPLSEDIKKNRTSINDYIPTVLLAGMIILLIGASFVPNKPALTNGIICIGLFIAGLCLEFIRTKDKGIFPRAFKEIDISTLLLLSGLFVVVAGITEAGLVEEISTLFVRFGGGSLFLLYTLIVWISVVFAAFIDNIPYVAAMLPVVSGIAAAMNINPSILYFGLLCGATLGGNFTPIGASANITAIGILRKNGWNVTTAQYMKISVPITLAAIVTGYLLIWIIWK